MKLSEAGLKFFAWCELEQSYSPKTVLNYEHHFRHFFEWSGDIELKAIDEDLILNYKKNLLSQTHAYQQSKTIKPSTVGEKMKVIRTLLHCMEIKGIKAFPSSRVPHGVRADDRIIFFTQNEFFMMADKVEVGNTEGKRDRAILETLFATGISKLELPLVIFWKDNDSEKLYQLIKKIRKEHGYSPSWEVIVDICVNEIMNGDFKSLIRNQ